MSRWLRLAAALVTVPLVGPALLLAFADLGQDRFHPGEGLLVFLKLAGLSYPYGVLGTLTGHAVLEAMARRRLRHYLLTGALIGVPAALFAGFWTLAYSGDAGETMQAATYCVIIGVLSGLAAWLIVRPDRRVGPASG